MVAEVPLGVVTVTSTVPVPGPASVEAGEVTTILPAVFEVMVPGLPAPKSTVGIPEKPVPLTVTVLPPAWGPLFGTTPVTVGSVL